MPHSGSILVVDDEDIMREILDALLTREGYHVRLASSGTEGIELAKAVPFDAAIVDVMMPGIDGIGTLEEIKKIDDDLPVLMITAFASVESAIAAMKRGAFDYITKPFKNDEVLLVVRNAVERRRLRSENLALRQTLRSQHQSFPGIVGRSPKMRQVFDLIVQAAPSRSTILITGESGTGKELAARAIHSNSSRSDRAFVTVNSGNLPSDLLESTLFGHVKGAFTGAVYPKKGLCDLADKGTIFFDEIGNIALDTQAKAEYRARLEDLRADIEEAEAFNDPERAARAREEMDFIAQELSSAVGLGGRDRRATAPSAPLQTLHPP